MAFHTEIRAFHPERKDVAAYLFRHRQASPSVASFFCARAEGFARAVGATSVAINAGAIPIATEVAPTAPRSFNLKAHRPL